MKPVKLEIIKNGTVLYAVEHICMPLSTLQYFASIIVCILLLSVQFMTVGIHWTTDISWVIL